MSSPYTMAPVRGNRVPRISTNPPRRSSEEGIRLCLNATSSQISTPLQRSDVVDPRNRDQRTITTPITTSYREYKENTRYNIDAQKQICTIENTQDTSRPEHKTGPCKGNKNCKTCDQWSNEVGHIKTAFNGKRIQCKLERDATCSTANIVYALTCEECPMTYVGETKQELRKRMSAHRGNIMGQKENTHLVTHFNKAHGRRIMPKVRILETMEPTATENERRTAEAKWTMALNTVHPWGLNTNIKGCGAITEMTDPAERRQCPWFCPRAWRQRDF